MEWSLIIQQLNTLASVLLVISPTVFVLSVTLLGDAIDQSQNEERAARENSKVGLQNEIDKIDIALKSARKSGDTTDLTSKLDGLKAQKGVVDKEIIKIHKKYQRINLINTVGYPSIAFIITVLITPISVMLKNLYLEVIICLIQSGLIVFGVFKLYSSLALVQSISAGKKESDKLSRLKDVIRTSLSEDRQSIKEEVEIELVDKAFPLNTTADAELEIKFRVKLIKGSVLKQVTVWFYISDGFDLIDPPEKDSWRQASNFNPPNIRTVKVDIGTLSIGPYIPRSLKVKTPPSPGRYLIRYAAFGEGYKGTKVDLTVLVG